MRHSRLHNWPYPGVVTPDELAGKRTGERIQILRERKGLTRPVLAGLVGMSPSWLKGIERGTRLPPRLPLLVKLAEALAVGDVAVLAGTDMDLGGASVPVQSSRASRMTRCPRSARRYATRCSWSRWRRAGRRGAGVAGSGRLGDLAPVD